MVDLIKITWQIFITFCMFIQNAFLFLIFINFEFLCSRSRSHRFLVCPGRYWRIPKKVLCGLRINIFENNIFLKKTYLLANRHFWNRMCDCIALKNTHFKIKGTRNPLYNFFNTELFECRDCLEFLVSKIKIGIMYISISMIAINIYFEF